MMFTPGQVCIVVGLMISFIGLCATVVTLLDRRRTEWIKQANEQADRDKTRIADLENHVDEVEKDRDYWRDRFYKKGSRV